MSEVGALIVRLQAETAQFREDMGKVKSDLNDLKGTSESTGQGMKASMGEAKGGLMLVEESVGIHIPRHLNTLIAGIPGVGQAFAMMLPIAGVVLAIEIISKLIDKHREMKDAAEQLQGAQNNLHATIASTFTGLQDKLLQAGIAADDLNGNHLAAVKKQLELIDNQSMAELAQTFDTLAKAADASFAQLKAHWYEFSAGSEGAKHSLTAFQAQYEMLLKTGKGDEANKLLDDKIARERQVLELQKEAASKEGTGMEQMARRANAIKQMVALTGQVVDYDDKALTSEQDMVDILQAQINARATIVKTAAIQKNTAETKGNRAELSDEANLQKVLAAGVEQHSQALIKLARTQAETAMAATKGGEDDGDDKLDQQKAAVEAEKDDAISAAKATLVAKLSVYNADLKAAGANAAKKKELDATWANDVHAYSDAVVQYNADANKQIVALDRADANQRAAIAKALAEAQADAVMKGAIEQAKLEEKSAETAAKNQQALHKTTAAQTLQAMVTASQAETQAEVSAYQTRLKNLDKFDKDYLKKVTELNKQIHDVEAKGESDVTALKATAAQKQAMDIQNSENRMKESIASSIANSIVMNKSLAAAFRQTGAAMAEQMLKNLIMMELTGDKEKLINAKKAYGQAFTAMAGIPPAPMWGYAAGAAAFAAVMSFEEGGKIPGASVGSAGAVPIIGHQGETVVTKALTDRVESSERNRGAGTGMPSINFAPQIHAVDATGVDAMLSKHASVFQRHITAAMRRMNK